MSICHEHGLDVDTDWNAEWTCAKCGHTGVMTECPSVILYHDKHHDYVCANNCKPRILDTMRDEVQEMLLDFTTCDFRVGGRLEKMYADAKKKAHYASKQGVTECSPYANI